MMCYIDELKLGTYVGDMVPWQRTGSVPRVSLLAKCPHVTLFKINDWKMGGTLKMYHSFMKLQLVGL